MTFDEPRETDQLLDTARSMDVFLNAMPAAPNQVFHSWSGTSYNTVPASDEMFFDELNAVIQYDSSDDRT